MDGHPYAVDQNIFEDSGFTKRPKLLIFDSNSLALFIKNENDELKDCFVIIIAQTKKVIGVRHKRGLWAYKRRLQTGKKDFDLKELEDFKKSVLYDNYNYLSYLKTYSNFIE